MAMYMAAILFDDYNENNNQVMRITRRILRDVSDPFSVPANEFCKLYR